jgi:hypothetical protein
MMTEQEAASIQLGDEVMLGGAGPFTVVRISTDAYGVLLFGLAYGKNWGTQAPYYRCTLVKRPAGSQQAASTELHSPVRKGSESVPCAPASSV